MFSLGNVGLAGVNLIFSFCHFFSFVLTGILLMLGHCNLTSPVDYYDEDMQHNTAIRKCICKKKRKKKKQGRFAGRTK